MLEISQTPFQVSLFWINAYEINGASSLAERTESKILIKLLYFKSASREDINRASQSRMFSDPIYLIHITYDTRTLYKRQWYWYKQRNKEKITEFLSSGPRKYCKHFLAIPFRHVVCPATSINQMVSSVAGYFFFHCYKDQWKLAQTITDYNIIKLSYNYDFAFYC